MKDEFKKILIVTYYWPPSGGVGVLRWLFFANHLKKLGWDPVIVTPENPAFEIQDSTLQEKIDPEIRIIKIPIWEPSRLLNKKQKDIKNVSKGGLEDNSSLSFVGKVAIWIRGNMLIPDGRRFWVKPTVKFLTRYVAEEEIKLVLTL